VERASLPPKMVRRCRVRKLESADYTDYADSGLTGIGAIELKNRVYDQTRGRADLCDSF
jgi:hypothetical protein